MRHFASNNSGCPANGEDSKVWSLALSTSKTSKTCWTFGIPFATGIIEFERLFNFDDPSELRKKSSTKEHTAAIPLPTMRVKVALPRWLSYKTLDIINYKAQIGWKQYLRVRNIFPDSYEVEGGLYQITPFHRACDTIVQSGSLNELRTQFENRDLTPWDENSRGVTLLTVGKVCSILILPFRGLFTFDASLTISGRDELLSMEYLSLFAEPRPERVTCIESNRCKYDCGMGSGSPIA